ncbi:hypothetical protein BDZ97DRAFT_1256869 [Flammula alnicola]|nr:hypothetical protein BDZ97DRAFT_1256869 [Flammula alnicola]
MEPRFKAAKLKRLVDERRQRIENRKKESRTFYDAVRRQLDATTWKQLPCTERIYQITVLSDYINSDNPSEEFPADTAAADIGKLLDSWRTYGKKALFHIMSEHQEPQEAEGFQESDLHLATAVFTCPFHGPNSTDAEVSFGLIGWDDAALHLECNLPWPFHHLCNGDLYFKAKFRFNPNGQHTAQHLLKLMGLNPNTTLASSLDDSSARFACMTCPLERKRRVEGRYVMTFKECVSHAIICSDHQPESFMILTEEATKSVIFHEDISEIRSAHSWCCKHCPEHFNNLVPRQAAVAHVKETHSISSPVEKVDFFYQQSRERLVRRQFFVGSDFPPCYRCNKCPEARKLRLWTWQTLLAHLTGNPGSH